jgi:hypothetical protein
MRRAATRHPLLQCPHGCSLLGCCGFIFSISWHYLLWTSCCAAAGAAVLQRLQLRVLLLRCCFTAARTCTEAYRTRYILSGWAHLAHTGLFLLQQQRCYCLATAAVQCVAIRADDLSQLSSEQRGTVQSFIAVPCWQKELVASHNARQGVQDEEEGLQGVFKRLRRNGHQLEKGLQMAQRGPSLK